MRKVLQSMLGILLAASVSIAFADEKTKAKTMTATGTVTAVSGDSLSIMKGSETMTFKVDTATRVTGKGLSHKSDALKSEGKPLTLPDTVAKDDHVVVKYYTKDDGTMHATEVKVQPKKAGTE